VHATHDRVQGNWPSFIFPGFAILAAYAARESWSGRIAASTIGIARRLAVPVAALILALVYAEAFFGVVPSRDPIARLTAVGFAPVADDIGRIAQQKHAPAIVTASYATASWLAFYLKPKIPIVQLDEDYRWLSAPLADPRLAHVPLLFVALEQKKPLPAIVGRFSQIHLLARLERKRRGAVIDRYDVYSVSGWRGAFAGRMP
jgi:hypothetical protein